MGRTPYFGGALAQVRATVRDTARYADLRRFLVCLVFYQAGIQAVIALAAVYAQQVMGFTTSDTLVLVLLVNITAAAGAFAFGYVQDRLGHVRTIVVTLAGWLGTRAARYLRRISTATRARATGPSLADTFGATVTLRFP